MCPGPLIWFDVDGDPPAAILECAQLRCGYLIVTGTFHDVDHIGTPILKASV